MINTSQEFKNKVNSGVKFVNYADITLRDGTVLNLTPVDFAVSGFSMVDEATDGKFGAGFAIGKIIDVTIANHTNKFSTYDFYKSIIYMYVAVELEDGRVLKERKGKYYVINPTSPGDTIKLSGVDSMYLFDKPYNASTAFPATLQTILSDCCLECGVNIGFGQFNNWNFIVNKKPEDATYREVVSYVAQLAGYNARINNNDALELIWYDTSQMNIDTLDGGKLYFYDEADTYDGGDFSNYDAAILFDGGSFTDASPENVTKIKSLSVSTDDVIITGVKVTIDSDNFILKGTDDYVININDNPLVEGKEDAIATYLLNRFAGLKFRPMTCEIANNPLFEPFDTAYVYDRKGNGYFTLINSVEYKISGFTKISCKAKDPIKNKTPYVSVEAKDIVKARREASALANEAYEKSKSEATKLANAAQEAAEKNAEAKSAEISAEEAQKAYEDATAEAERLAEKARIASGEEAERLAEAAYQASEIAAQKKADAAQAKAIEEAAKKAAELANQALEDAKKNTEDKLTIYDMAVQNMDRLASNAMGLYRESEKQSDGSEIYYQSNRPITKNSTGKCQFETGSVVYKMTGNGFFVSSDGGKSFTSGFDSNGNAIVNVLSAIGITFDWARGGTLSLGGDGNVNGKINVYNANGILVGSWESENFFLKSSDYKEGTYPLSIEFTSYVDTNGYYKSYIPQSSKIFVELSNKNTSNVTFTAYGDSNNTGTKNNYTVSAKNGQCVINFEAKYNNLVKIQSSSSGIKSIYAKDSDGNIIWHYSNSETTKRVGNFLDMTSNRMSIGNCDISDTVRVNGVRLGDSVFIGYCNPDYYVSLTYQDLAKYSAINLIVADYSNSNTAMLTPIGSIPTSLLDKVMLQKTNILSDIIGFYFPGVGLLQNCTISYDFFKQRLYFSVFYDSSTATKIYRLLVYGIV